MTLQCDKEEPHTSQIGIYQWMRKKHQCLPFYCPIKNWWDMNQNLQHIPFGRGPCKDSYRC